MHFSHNFAKLKVDEYDSLPLEKTLNVLDAIKLIKSVFIKNSNHCY